MAMCIAQQSSTALPPIIHPRKYLRTILTHDSDMSSISCRKRLFSEQNDYCHCPTKYSCDSNDINKRTKTGLCGCESKDNYQHHGRQPLTGCFIESIRICRSAPGLLRRKSVTHVSHTYIKNVSTTQTVTSFLPSLSKTTTTLPLEKNMLACQQTTVIIQDNEFDRNVDSIVLPSARLAAYMTAVAITSNPQMLIIDCGSPLRHAERRIQDSFLLNVNDKISRKRLTTRGLKNFLDSTQLNRLDKHETVVLYDDTIRPSAACAIPIQLAPAMKCVHDEIKRYDTNKRIYVLQSSFDEFYQHYPTLCRISTSTDEDLSSSSASPLSEKPVDIDSFPISEIFPGLYLGSSRDAEDRHVLQHNQIQTIINISTTIPCYFEEDKLVDYLRLPCHDSSNQNILQYFESTFEYIHQQLSSKKHILVHCQGGVSRSPSFIIGYLMRYHSKTFDQAYQLVKTQRCIINPNLNFLSQLTQYQHLLTNA